MNNKIYDAFNEIKAEDQLKQDTYAFLQNKLQRRKNIIVKRAAVTFASVFLVFFGRLLAYNLYFSEIAFIDIDVNPCIELTINRFDHVISAYAYNDDGQNVLNAVDIKNKPYEDTLEILIDEMIDQGYITEAGVFTATLQVYDGKNEKNFLDLLQAYISTALQARNQTVEQDVFTVDSEAKLHSHEQNLTPAKYLAILELQEIDPTATFDGCRNHTIGEIRQQTHGHGYGGSDGQENGTGQSDSVSNGHGNNQSENGQENQNHRNENPENQQIKNKHGQDFPASSTSGEDNGHSNKKDTIEPIKNTV